MKKIITQKVEINDLYSYVNEQKVTFTLLTQPSNIVYKTRKFITRGNRMLFKKIDVVKLYS